MADLQSVAYSQGGVPIGANNRHNRPQEGVAGIVQYQVDKDENGRPKKGKDGKYNIKYPETKEWHIFKLVDNTKKGNVYIPNIDDVMNPATGRVERVRLLAGVDTIWVKEQKDLTKEYISQNMVSLRFYRNQKMMRIAGHNHTALEFVRLTNSNVGNPLRTTGSRFEFYEYDFAAAEAEAFEKENFELEMALLAKQAKEEDMKKHAAFLGIRLINDIGEKKSADGIRREYVMAAKRNPKYFQQTMKTEQIEISWLVRKAIADSLIEVGREPGKIFWARNGGMIGVFAQTENPQDYLTNLAMTNTEEGKLFKEQLKQVVT